MVRFRQRIVKREAAEWSHTCRAYAVGLADGADYRFAGAIATVLRQRARATRLRGVFGYVKLTRSLGAKDQGRYKRMEERMRRFRFSLYVALALSALAYAGSAAQAEPCAVGLTVHNHAWITLKGKKLAQCTGAAGCKCVSCYNLDGSVTSACFALVK